MTEQARAREDAVRAASLASNAERDAATVILSDAYAQGRITADELSVRTTQALAARTHGDLAQVLQGLTMTVAPGRSHPARMVAFFILTVMTSPFLLVGGGLLLFGSDGGDRVFGIVLLALFLPGLLAIYRWADPQGLRAPLS